MSFKPLFVVLAVFCAAANALAKTVYTVKAGDTLSRIAQKQGVNMDAIRDLNPSLKNPNSLKVGQKIVLPDKIKKAAQQKSTIKKASYGQSSGWMWPVNGRITSGFGYRNIWVAGSNYHPAIDIAAATGTPVIASRGGVVRTAKFDNTGYGFTIVIDHGDGWSTRYSHNSRLLVSAGMVVEAGQRIALVGSTGFSTGAHLDFRVYKNGSELNPLNLLSRR